jgi:uncharacterized cupredoxin-like copper-binding protein
VGRRSGLAFASCAVIALAAVGISSAGTTATQLKFGLTEWAVSATPKSVGHGPVTFVVTNKGQFEHEFVVVKTNKDAAKLLNQNGKANLAGRRAEIEDIAPGKTKKLTLTLPAGHYVLLCNLDSHYKKGLRRNFTVK